MNIDGKKIAEDILAQLTPRVAAMQHPSRLDGILVSDNPDVDGLFLQLKAKAAERIGVKFRLHVFPSAITTKELRAKVGEIGKATSCSGIVVQLPLPAHVTTQVVANAIPLAKDIDALSQSAQGAFFVGRAPILPPAVASLKKICEIHSISLQGMRCAVFGYGMLIGRPVAHWLASQGATVSIINEFTKDPGRISQEADMIITGVGKAGLISGDMVKKDAIVIDFGYSMQDGKVVGDVAFDEVSKKASLITPVPGGMGPLVIATLLENLVALAESR